MGDARCTEARGYAPAPLGPDAAGTAACGRAARFRSLCRAATRCRLCPRLADKRAVLSHRNGTLTPRVLFIGEAPGRRGADRTRVPFRGDVSGQRFEALLADAGLTRADIFITNAVLCCPADDARNHTPAADEVRNCRPFLQRVLDLLRPRVVATVGAVALTAVGRLVCRRFTLADGAGTVIPLDDFVLVPLYHTSPRVLNTVRSHDEQRADFARLRAAIDESTAGPLAR